MNWRRWAAPRSGLTCACATVILLLIITSQLKAAETEFAYSASVVEMYNGDVFRTGGSTQNPDDFITILGLQTSFGWRTVRSNTSIDYAPEYLNYATYDALDGLNHRMNFSWGMTPGRRSSVGVVAGYSQTIQQSGFQSSTGVGGNLIQPIFRLTRRTTWVVEPSHKIDIGRRWSMETRAIYLSESFSNPSLIDSSTTGLIYTANARVRGIHTFGGIVRYGVNHFDTGASTTTMGKPQDRVLNLEASWAQQEGAIYRWTAAAGFFRVESDGRPTSTQPTLRLSASWDLYRSEILAGYDLGFSTVTGSVGTRRTESANIGFSRKWGRGFTASATGNYVRFENLVNDPQKAYLDGYSMDLQASYNWQTRWALSFQVGHLIQDQTNGRTLDFFQASVGLVFAPGG